MSSIPSRIEIAYRADDVERIAGRGKLVAAIGIENGYVLGKSLELLDRDYELGARYVTLVHDGDNDLARSARPKPDFGDGTVDTGVTELGAQAIARMNRLGIMVDVSHGSKKTALDAMRLSRAPVIASHSGVGGVFAHPRNMDDETLLALRDDGGVIQVVAYDEYLKPRPDEEVAALRSCATSVGLTERGGFGALTAGAARALRTRASARDPRALGRDGARLRRPHRLRGEVDRHRPRRHQLRLRRRRRDRRLAGRVRDAQRDGRARGARLLAQPTSRSSGAATCCAFGAPWNGSPRSCRQKPSDRELSTGFGASVLIYFIRYFSMLNYIREK